MDETDLIYTAPPNLPHDASKPHYGRSDAGPHVRMATSGDVGDVRRNRQVPDSTAQQVAVDSLYDPALDETHVKTTFKNFVLRYTGGNTADTNMSSAQTTGGGGFDVDLDQMADRTNHSTAAVPIYLRAIRALVEGQEAAGKGVTFAVNLRDVLAFDATLYQIIIHTPADCVVYMDEVLADITQQEFEISDLALRVCLYGHANTGCMRDLNPSHIESLVAFKGVIIRASQVIPDMQVALFRCSARVQRNQTVYICGHEETRQLVDGEVAEPMQCDACQAKFSFELCHTRCHFGNKQLLKIQESPENIPEGETPFTVMAYCYDDLVDIAKPGDRVEITGIYKVSAVRVVAKARNLKSVFRMYIDVNHINKESPARFQMGDFELDGPGSRLLTHSEFESDNMLDGGGIGVAGEGAMLQQREVFPEALVQSLRSIANTPNVYDVLVHSLAPNIWEADDVKKGLLCQLFSGTTKRMRGGGGRATRSDVHVLLCGDPSTAKSQLLQYVNQITPRGVYTCGKGTSAVGLTASVSKDPETREFILESGAIILSDRGICCIDEFDKMDDSARVILHEVMEQQTVSIAKAGIVCSLNARASILASANPIHSKYDTKRSVIENINLPPTLISRFDLIYLMLDTPSEETDRKLATHICSLYTDGAGRRADHLQLIDRHTFAQYVSFARRTCHPRLSNPACQELVETYVNFRRKGADSSGKSLSATPRQMESLIRLSESLAKMRLSETVTIDDVREAARLIQVATYTAIVDPVTGRIDIDQLNRGISGAARERREIVEKFILDALKGDTAGLDRENLQNKVQGLMLTGGYSERDCDHYLKDMENCVRNLESIGIIGKAAGGRFVASLAG